MEMRTFKKLATVAGIGASLFVGSSFLGASAAFAAACGPGSVADYTTPGFSCSVGPLTFSNFTVTTTASGSALVDVGGANAFNPDIVVYNGHTEYGFSLAYVAGASTVGAADVAVTYDVSAAPGNMVDAYMAFTGGASGPAAFATLSETLSNGSTMDLAAPGVTSTTFAPVGSLSAIKDQSDLALNGVAFSSILVDGFSVMGVPEPGTIALFGAGLLGCALFLRRRGLSVR